jgi:putative aminopeptidase FrvX
MQRNFNLLKEVLSIPTKTYKEDLMIDFISNWLLENRIPFEVDEYGNIYATKESQPVDKNFIFPCVVSHTDTVHNIDTINIKEENLLNEQGQIKLSLKAYNNDGKPTGIGGDDKCGVFACLELLKEFPYLKAAFFVSEETGCHGSRNADKNFFSNVGYAIQFDAPGNTMVTEFCMGTQLFDRQGQFFKTCDEVLTESFKSKNKYESHPYTDVYALKNLFDFSCINFAIGYYDYHSKNEYVVVEDVYNGIETGKKMIEKLGYKKYTKITTEKNKYWF